MPAGLTVSASLEVATAACAPPIALARGRSMNTGQGAPGSFTLLSARAAAAPRSRARRKARIGRAVYPADAYRGHRCYYFRGPSPEVPMDRPLRKVVIPAAGLGTR